MRLVIGLAFGVVALVSALAAAGEAPALPSQGQVGLAEYELADPHRAFAIAPGGVWAARSGLPSATEAERAALAACAEQTEQPCVLYAVDDTVVFDRQAWPRLWRPYADDDQAARAAVGTRRGERFPDLAFADGDGRPLTLSGLRGKVVVVHFWATWCPPCLAELPDLARLHRDMAAEPNVAFVLLQMREPVARARGWLERNHIAMPQYDSGADGRGSDRLRLADGATVADRGVAELFPTTYVLDRHGLVLFKSRGIATGWPEFAAFLRDAARP